jgi:hypothetical protein
MRLFLREGRKIKRRSAADHLAQAWMAANFDGDDIKRALNELNGE